MLVPTETLRLQTSFICIDRAAKIWKKDRVVCELSCFFPVWWTVAPLQGSVCIYTIQKTTSSYGTHTISWSRLLHRTLTIWTLEKAWTLRVKTKFFPVLEGKWRIVESLSVTKWLRGLWIWKSLWPLAMELTPHRALKFHRSTYVTNGMLKSRLYGAPWTCLWVLNEFSRWWRTMFRTYTWSLHLNYLLLLIFFDIVTLSIFVSTYSLSVNMYNSSHTREHSYRKHNGWHTKVVFLRLF